MNKRFVYNVIILVTIIALTRFLLVELLHLSEYFAVISEIGLVLIVFYYNERMLKITEDERDSIIDNIKASFPKFIDDFSNYCIACTHAIQNAKEGAEIYTVQTPLYIEEIENGIKHFEYYMKITCAELLRREDNVEINAARIHAYKRLIVLNNIGDRKEIDAEKKKLNEFIDKIHEQLNTWHDIKRKPDLSNIQIGLVLSTDIYNSPFSNLDVLLIRDTHLVVAFPIENTHSYEWGTSIHFEKNDYQLDIQHHVDSFKRIYSHIWDKKDVIKIKFGDLYNPNSIGEGIVRIKNQVDNAFAELLRKNNGNANHK